MTNEARGHEVSTWDWPRDLDAADFSRAVRRHRVEETLLRHVDSFTGLPDGVRQDLQERRDTNATASLGLIRASASIQQTLIDRGFEALLFKGIALALQTTGDPTARGYGDIDLLINGSDLYDVAETLNELGHHTTLSFPQDRDSWAARYFLRTSYETSFGAPASSIDLHWRLDPSPSAFPSLSHFWADRATYTIADRDVHTLPPLIALQHSCSHAGKDDGAFFRSLVDIHRLARHPDLPSDWRTRLRGVDRRSLGFAVDALGPIHGESFAVNGWSRWRARKAQAEAFPPPMAHKVTPAWVLGTRRNSASAQRLSDVAAVIGTTLLPGHTISNVTEPTFRKAFPGMVRERATHLRRMLHSRRSNRRGRATS